MVVRPLGIRVLTLRLRTKLPRFDRHERRLPLVTQQVKGIRPLNHWKFASVTVTLRHVYHEFLPIRTAHFLR